MSAPSKELSSPDPPATQGSQSKSGSSVSSSGASVSGLQESSLSTSSEEPFHSLRIRLENITSKNKWKEVSEVVRAAEEEMMKKPTDLENFLSQIDASTAGSAAVMGIYCMYNYAEAKNNEEGQMSYGWTSLSNGGEARVGRVMLTPHTQTIELVRAVSGVPMLAAAIDLLTDRSDYAVTTLHNLLFTLCLKSQAIEVAYDFVHPYVRSFFNQSNPYVISTASFETKQLLLYYYYGAIVVAQKFEWRRATTMLEVALTVTGCMVSSIQVDALKKLHLMSFLHSSPISLPPPHSLLMRSWRQVHGVVYLQLLSAIEREPESGNKAAAVEKILSRHRRHIAQDKNTGLVQLVIQELRDRAVLRVAKLYSVVALSKITSIAHLRDDDETIEIMDALIAAGRLSAVREGVFVRLAIPAPKFTQDALEDRREKVKRRQLDVEKLDVAAQLLQFSSSRCKPAASFLEDEGLSMSNSPETFF